MGGFWEAIAFCTQFFYLKFLFFFHCGCLYLLNCCQSDEGVEYGRGTGITEDNAMEQAAHQVLIALRGDDDDDYHDNQADQNRPHTVLRRRPNSGYLKIICWYAKARRNYLYLFDFWFPFWLTFVAGCI